MLLRWLHQEVLREWVQATVGPLPAVHEDNGGQAICSRQALDVFETFKFLNSRRLIAPAFFPGNFYPRSWSFIETPKYYFLTIL